MSEEKGKTILIRLYTKEREEKLERLVAESGLSRQEVIVSLIDGVTELKVTPARVIPVFSSRRFDETNQSLEASSLS